MHTSAEGASGGQNDFLGGFCTLIQTRMKIPSLNKFALGCLVSDGFDHASVNVAGEPVILKGWSGVARAMNRSSQHR